MIGRHLAANALTLMVVALAVLVVAIAWGQREFTAAGPLEQAICLRVERGANVTVVSRQLEAQGAVTQPAVFRIGANYTEKAGQLRFGSYLIQPHSSMEEILDVITRGGQSTCGTEVNYRVGVTAASTVVRELDPATNAFVEVANFDWQAEELPEDYLVRASRDDTRFRITVAEGATSWQIVEALRRAEFLTGDVAELPAEGTLAPESYEVARGADRAALIAQMESRQAAILEQLWAQRSDRTPVETPEEALILASIIEKETGVADERGKVASVFVNRLNTGMRLQMDATVEYGVTNGQGSLGRGLRQSELRAVTPYNTYAIDGLPAGPIANPGRAAIAAALNPDETDYLYFVADGTGGHAFATNLADHNRNVAQWRQIEAEQRAGQGQ